MKGKQKMDNNSFIRDCKLTLRTQNMLYNNSQVFGVAYITPITKSNLRVLDIGKLSLKDIGTFRNCGKKTLSEINELCQRTGVVLKQ